MTLEKKAVFLSGSVRFPLKTGENAIIFHNGGITRTSTVAAIRQVAEDLIVFETQDSAYCVALKFSPVPTALAVRACA